MGRDQISWAVILKACGVKDPQVSVYAPLFEQHMKSKVFSLGEKEMDDFIGQTLHESNMLTRTEENLRYSAKRIRELGVMNGKGSAWARAAARADELEYNPIKLANVVYAGRMGNGNEASGDGWKYRGMGLIMCTGFSNYFTLEKLTGLPLTREPELMKNPTYALQCSIAWWENGVPDRLMDDPRLVTRKVNGGEIGLDHRIELTNKARQALALYME